MKRALLMGLLAVTVVVQLVVPASMIVGREAILAHGRLYKFRTVPIDPYDAFRGRYVALGFEESSGPAAAGVQIERGQTVYLKLSEDPQGFAHIAAVATTPFHGDSYVAATAVYLSGARVHVRLPFGRYYMREDLAPAAERAYRQHSRQRLRDAYATVRVRNGEAVIDGLYVGGEPIEKYIRTHPARD